MSVLFEAVSLKGAFGSLVYLYMFMTAYDSLDQWWNLNTYDFDPKKHKNYKIKTNVWGNRNASGPYSHCVQIKSHVTMCI